MSNDVNFLIEMLFILWIVVSFGVGVYFTSNWIPSYDGYRVKDIFYMLFGIVGILIIGGIFLILKFAEWIYYNIHSIIDNNTKVRKFIEYCSYIWNKQIIKGNENE